MDPTIRWRTMLDPDAPDNPVNGPNYSSRSNAPLRRWARAWKRRLKREMESGPDK